MLTLKTGQRIIDNSMPVKVISDELANENQMKSPKTIHQWFARRPLVSSRAFACAALVDWPDDEAQAKKVQDMLKMISKENPGSCDEAKKYIRKAYGGRMPRVLDPFGGGGIIPLECIRLGCEVFSNDYNPVAAIVQKCTIEYPQKYNEGGKLVDDLRSWCRKTESKLKSEFELHFPRKNGAISDILWVRMIPCPMSGCGAHIPLLHSFRLTVDGTYALPKWNGLKISFDIVSKPAPETLPRMKGTVLSKSALCINCGGTINSNMVNKLLVTNPDLDVMVAVAERHRNKKILRKVTQEDIDAYSSCQMKVDVLCKTFADRYGIDPIADVIVSTPTGHECGVGGAYWSANRPSSKGLGRWSQFYNLRQKFVLATILNEIRRFEDDLTERYSKEYATCIMCYFAVMLDNMAVRNSRLTRWEGKRAKIAIDSSSIEARDMYVETNPLDKISGMYGRMDLICNGITEAARVQGKPAMISCRSATSFNYEDGFFDAIFTDPPYYDMKEYAELSDYYYVWMKRSIGHLFPDWFGSALSPKSDEIIRNDNKATRCKSKTGLKLKTKEYFERKLSESFREITRMLADNGVCTVVYSHKGPDSWESLINSIKNSGLIITAAWPVLSESEKRKSAIGTASINSTIYMACRKGRKIKNGRYKDVKDELQGVLGQLDDIADCISKEDYLIAAIGFGLKHITKYEIITNDSGESIPIAEILSYIRTIAIRHALSAITDTDLDPLTNLYVLWRHFHGNHMIKYDNVLLLSEGAGVEIMKHAMFQKDHGHVKLLGPDERGNAVDIGEDSVIDVIHKSYLLWKSGKTSECRKVLARHVHKEKAFKAAANALIRAGTGNSTEAMGLREYIQSIGDIRSYLII